VVIRVVVTVTLGVDVIVKHHDELTLKCRFAFLSTFVAHVRILTFLPSSPEPGLHNCLNLIFHLHHPVYTHVAPFRPRGLAPL
jgi:hypothetical protein